MSFSHFTSLTDSLNSLSEWLFLALCSFSSPCFSFFSLFLCASDSFIHNLIHSSSTRGCFSLGWPHPHPPHIPTLFWAPMHSFQLASRCYSNDVIMPKLFILTDWMSVGREGGQGGSLAIFLSHCLVLGSGPVTLNTMQTTFWKW